MTKAELKTFVEDGLLNGDTINTTLFDVFLDHAQMYMENLRPWVILRTEDTSQSISSSTTFETQKALPTDFRKWYTRFPVILTDSNGRPQEYLAEVPLHDKTKYRDHNTKFYCNYGSNYLFICGSHQSLTVRQYYIRKTTLVSGDDDNEWVFPSEYHHVLGLIIAVFYKHGVDYDIINSKQSDSHIDMTKQVYSAMSDWDSDLAESALNGADPMMSGQGVGMFGGDGMSGHVGDLM